MKTINSFYRSTAYREFASWYRYPEQSSLDELKARDQEVIGAFEALAAQGHFAPMQNIRSLFEDMECPSLSDLQAEYVRLFDYRPPCPMFESSYTEQKKNNPGKIKLSIEEFYNEFGLDASPTSFEPPDHLMLELEFMHFLSFKEGEAFENDGSDVEKYLMGQQRFSEDHLMKWVPAFCDRLSENAELSYYKALAVLTEGFLLQDTDYINLLCRELQ